MTATKITTDMRKKYSKRHRQSDLKVYSDYLMVIPVQFYRIDENTFACESAFAQHLKTLKTLIGKKYRRMLVIAPKAAENDYLTNQESFAIINSVDTGIYFKAAYPNTVSRLRYMLIYFWPVISKLWKAVNNAAVVHAGPSQNIFKPFEIISIIFAVIKRKKTVFVVDIDQRNSARMSYATGNISKKSYLLLRYLYDPALDLQIRFAAKFCTLCLFKSQSMVDKYAKGLNVKNFLDTAHSAQHVLTDTQLQKKIQHFIKPSKNINITFFGRLTAYKGIKDMLDAISEIVLHSDLVPKFTIIGTGEQYSELQHYTNHLNLSEYVDFIGALPYGDKLFECLYKQDILLAAPLREDTPRSLFDGMTAGLITIAYDTYYYADMAQNGTVITVPWRDSKAIANAIIDCAENRLSTSEIMVKARNFSLQNTQEIWLERRLKWIEEAIGTL